MTGLTNLPVTDPDGGDLSGYATEKFVAEKVDEHADSQDNPHGVTAAQTGAFGIVGDVARDDNLDNYRTIGSYYCTASNANTVVNSPITTAAYHLHVFKASATGNEALIQICTRASVNESELFFRKHAAGWGDWKTIATENFVEMAIAGLKAEDIGAASATHASQHKAGGSDSISPSDIGAYGYHGVMSGNDDLNNYTSIGSYSATSSVTRTLSNCPFSSGALQLHVFLADHDTGSAKPLIQIITQNSAGSAELYIRKHASGAWSEWCSILHTGTVTVSATDITAGTTALATGAQYLVYE